MVPKVCRHGWGDGVDRILCGSITGDPIETEARAGTAAVQRKQPTWYIWASWLQRRWMLKSTRARAAASSISSC